MIHRLSILSLCAAGVLAVTGFVSGCTGSPPMSEKQKEAVDLRRYCESNPQDVVRCLGFLGDH